MWYRATVTRITESSKTGSSYTADFRLGQLHLSEYWAFDMGTEKSWVALVDQLFVDTSGEEFACVF